MKTPFALLSLGHCYLLGGLLYRKVDDHLVKRVVDGRTEAAPRGYEAVEPVIVASRKEEWPIPPEEQEWFAWRLVRIGGAALHPVGVGATEQAAIRDLAALVEADALAAVNDA